MIHDIAFLVVFGLGSFLYWKERKARIVAESQVLALASQVARIASESAKVNAEMVAAQTPIVQHHEMLLDYLKNNDGKSVDEAKQALDALKAGIEEAGEMVASMTFRPHDPDHHVPDTHHGRLLAHIRANPGISVDSAKEALKSGN